MAEGASAAAELEQQLNWSTSPGSNPLKENESSDTMNNAEAGKQGENLVAVPMNALLGCAMPTEYVEVTDTGNVSCNNSARVLFFFSCFLGFPL